MTIANGEVKHNANDNVVEVSRRETLENLEKALRLVNELKLPMTPELPNRIKAIYQSFNLNPDYVTIHVDDKLKGVVAIDYEEPSPVKHLSINVTLNDNLVEEKIPSDFYYNKLLNELCKSHGLKLGTFLTNRIAQMLRDGKGYSISDLQILKIHTWKAFDPKIQRKFVENKNNCFAQDVFRFKSFFNMFTDYYLVSFNYRKKGQ